MLHNLSHAQPYVKSKDLTPSLAWPLRWLPRNDSKRRVTKFYRCHWKKADSSKTSSAGTRSLTK